MIPIRSVVVSAVLLSKIESEIKLLLMKRVKGDYWCHVAGKVEESTVDSSPGPVLRFRIRPRRPGGWRRRRLLEPDRVRRPAPAP